MSAGDARGAELCCNGQEKVWVLSAFGQCHVPFKRGDWQKGVGARCRAITRVQTVCRRVADSAVESGEQGQDKAFCQGLAQRLNPLVAFIRCHCSARNSQDVAASPLSSANCILRPTTPTTLVRSWHLWQMFVTQEAYCFASLPSHQLTKNSLEFHFITNVSFEEQLLSISAFPDV